MTHLSLRVAAAIALGTFVSSSLLVFQSLAAESERDMVHVGDRSLARVEQRANSSLAGDQGNVSLALARDGGVTVAWQSRRQQAGSSGVYAQRFNRHGDRLGGETRLPATTTAHVEPAIALDAQGVWWAAYLAHGADGDQFGAVARPFDAKLERPGAERLLNADPEGSPASLALAPLADGLVAAWVQPTADGARRQAVVRRFDRDGAPLGAPRALATGGADRGEDRWVALAAFAGGFVAVRAGGDAAHRPDGVTAQVFDARGEPVGEAVRVNAGDDPGAIEPAVAAHDAGFVVAWMQRDAGDYAVLARRFDRQARPLGEPSVVSASGTQSGAAVACARDGRFVVAFNHGDDVRAVTFTAAGAATGPAFTVNRPGRGTHALAVSPRPRAAFGDDGRLAFAWAGAGDGDEHGGFVTMLVPEGSPAPRADLVARNETPMPHDPPVFVPPAKHVPNGGDPNPTALADFGFQGITQTQFSPPDPHVAVGPNHVVAMVNDGIAWWSKNGVKQNEQRTSNAAGFWGPQGATNFVFDPEVIFDPFSQRFMAMACERNPSSGSGSSYFLLAVSDDADPNGTWHKYRLDVTAIAGGGDIDSPQIAVDPVAVYLSADFFSTGNRYFIYILDKTPLLSGLPPTTTRTHTITVAQSQGMPVMYEAAPALYLIEHVNGAANTIRLHALQNPLTTPSRTTIALTVPAYNTPVAVPQLGTTSRFSTFNARFWSCVYRNGSLWACHHYGAGTRTLSRWYQIAMNGWPATGTPALVQSGDVDPGAGISSFFNSISVDGFGNALMCYARSSPNEYVSIERSYRLAGDALGTMRPGVIVKANTGPYVGGRWGDYSAVGVDPSDNATFWYHHEYAAGNSWITWIGATTPHQFPLTADGRVISATGGGSVGLALHNPAKAGKPYLILGTLSGTSPGFLLPSPPGNVRMPINFDAFTNLVLTNPRGPFFAGFFGTLDGNGDATATLTLPALPPAVVGATMHYAFLQDGTLWDFASNPIEIRFSP